MRRVMALMMAFAITVSLAVVSSAHDKHGRMRGWRHGNRVRVVAPFRVLGTRYYNQDNYGRRRSAFAHYQNARRRAVIRHLRQERMLARHQREERRRLRLHHRFVRERARW